jgi:hypothetical protein
MTKEEQEMSIAILEQQARSQLIGTTFYATVGFILLSIGLREAFDGAQLMSVGSNDAFLKSALFSALTLISGGAMADRAAKRFGSFVENTIEASQQRLALRPFGEKKSDQ